MAEIAWGCLVATNLLRTGLMVTGLFKPQQFQDPVLAVQQFAWWILACIILHHRHSHLSLSRLSFLPPSNLSKLPFGSSHFITWLHHPFFFSCMLLPFFYFYKTIAYIHTDSKLHQNIGGLVVWNLSFFWFFAAFRRPFTPFGVRFSEFWKRRQVAGRVFELDGQLPE